MMMRGGPLMQALDTDRDGELSAAEIAAAATALKTLDKNGDGKLAAEELRPSFGEAGPGGARADGNAEAIARFMANDKNNDGKLSEEELPERMKGIMARADADKDGFVTKAELEKALAAPVQRRESGPRSERGERPAEAK
jgi:Ca2+-binding EF-hand superfamily protein